MHPASVAEESAAGAYSGLSPEELLVALPPPPSPQYAAMRVQACGGCCFVLIVICVCVGGTYYGTELPTRDFPDSLKLALRYLVYTEAAVAIICLLGLMWGDPGVVHRSTDSCFPLPEQVLDILNEGKDFSMLKENIVNDEGSFCIRCLVWRRSQPGSSRFKGDAFHHCSICQRCVRHFDHHCGVFGRCIAGRGLRGNMGYFRIIIITGFLGGATLFVTWAMVLREVGQGHTERIPALLELRKRIQLVSGLSGPGLVLAIIAGVYCAWVIICSLTCWVIRGSRTCYFIMRRSWRGYAQLTEAAPTRETELASVVGSQSTQR